MTLTETIALPQPVGSWLLTQRVVLGLVAAGRAAFVPGQASEMASRPLRWFGRDPS